ncbi:MAG: hypothetical protein KIS97_06700 [Nitrospira sp.]|nr:hypothetical protein [Nitrospira sp.]MCW5794010.1 hypothetical protein [Nitrospira sp.]
MPDFHVSFSEKQVAVLMAYCMMLEHKTLEELIYAAVGNYLSESSGDVGAMFWELSESEK